MKKRMKELVAIFLLTMLCTNVTAQEIEVNGWEKISSISQVPSETFINSKLLKRCAAVILSMNKSVDIDADCEIVKKDVETIYNDWNQTDYVTVIYLLPETSSLTISRKDLIPFCYYIPVELEVGKVYRAKVNVTKKNSTDTRTYTTISSADIVLSDFRENPKALIASTNPRYDNAGNACAVIRYNVNDANFVIEPNLGVVDSEVKPGQIIQYVPEDTRRLTIRNGNYMPVSGYVIPVKIRAKMTYDVNVLLSESSVRRKMASPDHDNYLGVGYDGTMLFSTEGGTRTFTIHCNSSWDISAPSWCQLSETNGYGIKEISVKVKRNSNTTRKVGVITVTSNGITSTIDVEQNHR